MIFNTRGIEKLAIFKTMEDTKETWKFLTLGMLLGLIPRRDRKPRVEIPTEPTPREEVEAYAHIQDLPPDSIES